MFAKNQVIEGGFGEAETIIGASVKVEGNFVCQGNMIIDGEVRGLIKTNKALSVGAKSVIYADIEADNARIAGEIHGNLRVNGFLELSETAKVFGDIEVTSLSIAQGAVFNGNCVMVAGLEKSTEAE